MGRSHITPIQQPDEHTCGPAALKLALEVFGKHKSLPSLIALCKTNRNGTTTPNLIAAANKLGFSVLAVEYATLHHLQSALKYPSNQPRAALVTYLYEKDKQDRLHPDSGHWTLVSSYSARSSRIILLDSSTAKKKSYKWEDFRDRWIDYDLKRRKLKKRGRKFRLVRRWQQQLLLILAKQDSHLPKFTIATAKLFIP